MNRPIEFRAFYDGKIWAVDELHFSKGELDGVILWNYHEINDLELRRFSVEVEMLEVMQFTGLFDSKEVKIFEGDIVKHPQGVDKVWWRGSGWHLGNWNPGHLDERSSESLEVIGNIFESPEMLIKDKLWTSKKLKSW